ncbi:MAG TPA: TetR/AcrR family transcriptional regulator [Pseudonocardiaceae bacterium]|nr:TetR/AcrR family transcriptional regulator [Pseudonocardiaceae bacterium]
MSELAAERPRRRRRSDAERSIAAILDAAVPLLGDRPDASMEDIAEAAGVTRQTVYAHFSSRDALLGAVVARVTEQVAEAIDAAELDQGSATDALVRFVDASWQMLERTPVLLRLPVVPVGPREELERHEPITSRLTELIRRGQRAGEFDQDITPEWLLAATIALGHAAGEQVSAGLMPVNLAGAAYRRSLLRVFGVTSD